MIACHVIRYPSFVHWECIFNVSGCHGVSLSSWRHSNSLKFRKNRFSRLNQFYLKMALTILMKHGMDLCWGRNQLLMTSLTTGKLPLWRHNGSKISKILILKSDKVVWYLIWKFFSGWFEICFFAIMTSSRDVIDVNVLKNGDFRGFDLVS